MVCNISKDCIERSNFGWTVIWNSDVVLSLILCCWPDVTASLSSDGIS